MYTKIKQWFMKFFAKPEQTPVADRVEPLVTSGVVHLTVPEPPPMRYVKDDKVRKELPKTAPKAPPPKVYSTAVTTTQSDINSLLTQAVIASVILSDTSDTHSKSTTTSDYGCSSRSSNSSSSYDSGSSSSDSSSSSSSGCD